MDLVFYDLIVCFFFNCVYFLESPTSDGAQGAHRAVGPMGPKGPRRKDGGQRQAGGRRAGWRAETRKALAMPARPASFPEAWQKPLFTLKKKKLKEKTYVIVNSSSLYKYMNGNKKS